jgi:hypothetical protein
MPESPPRKPSDWVQLILVVCVVCVVSLAGALWWKNHPVPAPAPKPPRVVKPVVTPQVMGHGTMVYTVYLPNEQAFLSRKKIEEKNPFPKPPTWEMKAGRTLELLFKKLTDLPPGTKILQIPKREKNGVVQINLSREFSRIQTKPDTVVALVLDAIASTLGAVEANGKTLNGGKPLKVRVLIENQPLREFSEFDLSEPWKSTQPQDETAPDAENVT